MQLREIEAGEGLGLRQGGGDGPVQPPGEEQGGLVAVTEGGRHLAVVLGGVVEPLLAVGEALAPPVDRHQGAGREVVEQGRRPLPGQTHQPPHALGGAALQEQVEGGRVQQLLQTLGHPLPQGLGDQGGITGGGEAHLLHHIEGTLAGGIELPQFLQVLTEELQPHRQFGTHREDVDDVPPAAPGAFLLDRRHPLVAQAGQGEGQVLQIQPIPLAQGEAAIGQHGGGGQVGLEGPLGGHHGEPGATPFVSALHQLGEHLQLAPGDLGGGVERLIGGALAGGIELAERPAHELQQGGPSARLLQGGHDHQQGGLAAAGQGAGHQGPRGPARPAEPQALGPLAARPYLGGEGRGLQLADQGMEGHRSALINGWRSSQPPRGDADRQQIATSFMLV